jgi:hypothetical protein
MSTVLSYDSLGRTFSWAKILALTSNIFGALCMCVPALWSILSLSIARFNAQPGTPDWPQRYIYATILTPMSALALFGVMAAVSGAISCFAGARFVSCAFGIFTGAVTTAIVAGLCFS